MQPSNAKRNFRSEDPVWVLLAELSVRDFLSDQDRKDNPTAGLIFQTMRELGMPLECVENIAMLVTEFSKDSRVHDQQEGLEFPARMRIFCQKQIIDDAKSTRTTSQPYHTEQGMEHSPMILDFGAKMSGGWGCFLLKRGGNVSDDASLRSEHFVDLYLYREG